MGRPLLAGGLALVSMSCTPVAVPGTTTNPPPVGNEVIVSWIVDGDTIEVDAEAGTLVVRLLGINAPDDGECFYDEATDHLIDILKGRTIRLDTDGTDQFDRVLAWVWDGDTLVNRDLVERGLAIATTRDPDDRHHPELITEEERAIAAGAGLWARSACGPESDADLSLEIESDPPGPDDEALGAEMVTVRNTGDSAVDLSGWVLRDESSRHRFHFAAGETLDPGAELTIPSDDEGWDPGGEAVWSNIGDMALLLDQHGNVVARMRYRQGD
jgi:micrococcal nuclease